MALKQEPFDVDDDPPICAGDGQPDGVVSLSFGVQPSFLQHEQPVFPPRPSEHAISLSSAVIAEMTSPHSVIEHVTSPPVNFLTDQSPIQISRPELVQDPHVHDLAFLSPLRARGGGRGSGARAVVQYPTYTISHNEAEVNSKLLPKKYRCRFCVYKTSYKSDLNRHLRKHGLAMQHCPLCNMPFKTTGNLENHVRHAHGEEGNAIFSAMGLTNSLLGVGDSDGGGGPVPIELSVPGDGLSISLTQPNPFFVSQPSPPLQTHLHHRQIIPERPSVSSILHQKLAHRAREKFAHCVVKPYADRVRLNDGVGDALRAHHSRSASTEDKQDVRRLGSPRGSLGNSYANHDRFEGPRPSLGRRNMTDSRYDENTQQDTHVEKKSMCLPHIPAVELVTTTHRHQEKATSDADDDSSDVIVLSPDMTTVPIFIDEDESLLGDDVNRENAEDSPRHDSPCLPDTDEQINTERSRDRESPDQNPAVSLADSQRPPRAANSEERSISVGDAHPEDLGRTRCLAGTGSSQILWKEKATPDGHVTGRDSTLHTETNAPENTVGNCAGQSDHPPSTREPASLNQQTAASSQIPSSPSSPASSRPLSREAPSGSDGPGVTSNRQSDNQRHPKTQSRCAEREERHADSPSGLSLTAICSRREGKTRSGQEMDSVSQKLDRGLLRTSASDSNHDHDDLRHESGRADAMATVKKEPTRTLSSHAAISVQNSSVNRVLHSTHSTINRGVSEERWQTGKPMADTHGEHSPAGYSYEPGQRNRRKRRLTQEPQCRTKRVVVENSRTTDYLHGTAISGVSAYYNCSDSSARRDGNTDPHCPQTSRPGPSRGLPHSVMPSSHRSNEVFPRDFSSHESSSNSRSFHDNIVLNQPPSSGRYARLVSDFDEFSAKPYACALCFFRTSSLGELRVHCENHLTGCNRKPVPETAAFQNVPARHTESATSPVSWMSSEASSPAEHHRNSVRSGDSGLGFATAVDRPGDRNTVSTIPMRKKPSGRRRPSLARARPTSARWPLRTGLSPDESDTDEEHIRPLWGMESDCGSLYGDLHDDRLRQQMRDTCRVTDPHSRLSHWSDSDQSADVTDDAADPNLFPEVDAQPGKLARQPRGESSLSGDLASTRHDNAEGQEPTGAQVEESRAQEGTDPSSRRPSGQRRPHWARAHSCAGPLRPTSADCDRRPTGAGSDVEIEAPDQANGDLRCQETGCSNGGAASGVDPQREVSTTGGERSDRADEAGLARVGNDLSPDTETCNLIALGRNSSSPPAPVLEPSASDQDFNSLTPESSSLPITACVEEALPESNKNTSDRQVSPALAALPFADVPRPTVSLKSAAGVCAKRLKNHNKQRVKGQVSKKGGVSEFRLPRYSTDRSFQCPQCEKRFSLRPVLVRHLTTMHAS